MNSIKEDLMSSLKTILIMMSIGVGLLIAFGIIHLIVEVHWAFIFLLIPLCLILDIIVRRYVKD